MFHHNPHFHIWRTLERHLKKGEYDAVFALWQQSLPELAAHYDELRILYYIGRFGQRLPYQQACSTLGYLRDAEWENVQYRLSIFRYAAETSIANAEIRQWMIEDLAAALGVTADDFPSKKLTMPKGLKATLKKINPQLGDSYDY